MLPSSIVRVVHKQSKAKQLAAPTYVTSLSAMASRSALIALLVVVSSVAAASAATFTVGDSSGWTLGSVNYTTWASGKTFAPGDTLGACVVRSSITTMHASFNFLLLL